MQMQPQTGMAPGLRNERGVTMALALFALVVIGTFVSGAFFLGLQEQRVGQNTIKHEQAFGAAEEGAQITLASWNGGTFNNLAIGDSVTFTGSLASAAGWYRGSVMRLNDMMFLVRSEGFSPDSAARHHVGLMARLLPIEVDVNAAFTTQGQTTVRGNSVIDGNDREPTGWGGCPVLLPTAPGIRIGDDADVTEEGASHDVYGSPPILEDTTVTAKSLLTFGDQTIEDLKQAATKILPPGTYTGILPSMAGGACNTSDTHNWGDPWNPGDPCGSYFPVVYVKGDMTVKGKRGQGVLIVDGNLTVQGNFEFVGLVIVTGALATSGTGQKYTGAVIAANQYGEKNDIAGDAQFLYSNCAVLRALLQSAPARMLRERGWVSLF
jgi:hypothetical protein